MMMKKNLCTLLFGLCLVSVSACTNQQVSGNVDNTIVSSSEREITEENKDAEERVNTKEYEQNTTNEGEQKIEFEELNKMVLGDVEDTIASIKAENEKLVTDIDTYNKYLENTDKMEAFYQQICNDVRLLCIRMREYSIQYAENIMRSDQSNDDKYDDLEELYDCIYDDAGDEIYDEIYEDIFDDLYDAFYDGILDDAYDNGAQYDEWLEALSDEYDWWLDARSDIYDEWSDFRSDVYDFWSDIRSELWDDDIEKAEEKIADFQDDIEKLKRKNIQEDTKTSSEENSNVSVSEETAHENVNINMETADGMRPEFKEAMDSYEAFYDKYCDVIKKYTKNPTDTHLLAEYTEMLTKSAEMTEKFEAWEDNELNNAELKYYLDVNNRIMQKLLEVSQ